MLPEILKVITVLHVCSVVIWMGVLLFMPRLFIYQTEANTRTEPDRSVLINQYKVMAKRLWNRVGWPAMGLTIVFGLGIMHPYFSSVWFWVKMGFVVALIVYHHMIHFTNKNLQRDNYKKTITQLKTLNHTGFIFLISIVGLAVLKDMVKIPLIIGAIAILVILIFIAGRTLVKKSSAT